MASLLLTTSTEFQEERMTARLRQVAGFLVATFILFGGGAWATGVHAPRDFVQPGNFSALPYPHAISPSTLSDYDPQRLLAGHLLRRIGFGPDKREMKTVLKMGINAYIDMQLDPSSIDDTRAEGKLPDVP